MHGRCMGVHGRCTGVHGCAGCAWGLVGIARVAARPGCACCGEALCVCKRRRRSARVERYVAMIGLECRLASAEQASLAC